MMKTLILSWLSIAAMASQLAAAVEGGLPLPAGNFTVAWEATDGMMGKTVTVYRVAPTHFAPQVVSNMLTEMSFTDQERQPPFPDHPGAIQYAIDGKRRYLSFIPSSGRVVYEDQDAIALPRAIQGVPSEKEALERAISLIKILGIERHQMLGKPDSPVPTYSSGVMEAGYFDKVAKKHVKEPCARIIIFFRQVDGWKLKDAGISIRFGNEGRISSLDAVWPTLEAHSRGEVVRTELERQMREGRCIWEWTARVDGLKKLTIKKVTPHYLFEEDQELVRPYAVMDVIADFGDTNLPGQVCCPLLKTDE